MDPTDPIGTHIDPIVPHMDPIVPHMDPTAPYGPHWAPLTPLGPIDSHLMEPHGPGSVLFGCELTASTKSYTFQVDEDDDSDHVLALSVVCLTDGAKDECNVVEVIGRNHKNQEITVPVANLKLSCQPLLSLDNFKLQPPVTFRLAAGSGPVHLAGWHQILHRDDASFEEEEEDDDDDMSEEEIAPIVPAKKERRKQ